MGSSYPEHAVDQALSALLETKPSWVERVTAKPTVDQYDAPAIDVDVIVRAGEREVFFNGDRLNGFVSDVHAAMSNAGVELWPFVRFVSADDLDPGVVSTGWHRSRRKASASPR